MNDMQAEISEYDDDEDAEIDLRDFSEKSEAAQNEELVNATIEAGEEINFLNRSIPNMELMPAGQYFPNYGGFGIYIKWKGNGTRDTVTVKSASSWTVHLETPDREIYVVGNLHTANAALSLGDWDEFVPLSLFHEANLSEMGCGPTHFMVNAHQSKSGKSREGSDRNHRTRERANYRAVKTIVGDSGGFQLKKKGNFIDPETVAEFYNNNVDIGMVLDMPLYDARNEANIQSIMELQRNNIEIMMSRINNRVKLCNIAHGIDKRQRVEFLKGVHHENIHAVAITKSSHTENPIGFVHEVIQFVEALEKNWPGHYDHLHILALSDNRTYIPLMRAAAEGLLGNIKITMDSATAIQLATTKAYVQHRHSTENYAVLKFGTDSNFVSPMQRLPCSCPVCRALGWTDAMTVLTSNMVTMYLVMFHNIYTMDAYFRNMLWYCTKMTDGDLQQMVQKIFHKKDVRADVGMALNYVKDRKVMSVKEMKAKYSFYLGKATISNDDAFMPSTGLDLFDGMAMLGEEAELLEAGFVDTMEDGTPESRVPLCVLDAERIALYNRKLETLRISKIMSKEKSMAFNSTRKTGKKLQRRIVQEDGSVKLVTLNKSEKKTGKAQQQFVEKMNKDANSIKVVHTTKTESGPSLKKQRQSVKNKANKKKNEGQNMGRTVVKSKNHKRL